MRLRGHGEIEGRLQRLAVGPAGVGGARHDVDVRALGLEGLAGEDGAREAVKATMLFNLFVFLQVWNYLNCRSTTFHESVLTGLMESRLFVAILVTIVVTQVLIIQFGGRLFETVPLDFSQWGFTVAIGGLAIPFGWIVRAVGRRLPGAWFAEAGDLVESGEEPLPPVAQLA